MFVRGRSGLVLTGIGIGGGNGDVDTAGSDVLQDGSIFITRFIDL